MNKRVFIFCSVWTFILLGCTLENTPAFPIDEEATLAAPWEIGENVKEWGVPALIKDELVYFVFYRKFLGIDKNGFYIVQDFYKRVINKDGTSVIHDFGENGERKYTDAYLLIDKNSIIKTTTEELDYVEHVSGSYIRFNLNGRKIQELKPQTNESQGVALAWHDNGQKSAEGYYQNGKALGIWRGWYPDGSMQWESYFENGVRQGPWILWYQNGQKKAEGQYKDNELHGFSSWWYSNGQIWSEKQYDTGNRVGVWRKWDEQGNLLEEKDYGHLH